MVVVEREIDQVLTLLRNKIRERGFTQLEVQEALAWGRSYISQLLTKQKSLRVEQVLLILNVIGVNPAEFYGELYRLPKAGAAPAVGVYPETGSSAAASGGERAVSELSSEFQEMRSLVRGLVRLLVDREMIDVEELTAAVKSCDEEETGAETDSGEVREEDSPN